MTVVTTGRDPRHIPHHNLCVDLRMENYDLLTSIQQRYLVGVRQGIGRAILRKRDAPGNNQKDRARLARYSEP